MLDRQDAPEDVHVVELAPAEVEDGGVPQQLALLAPHDGAAVEREDRVLGHVAHRVSHGLSIAAVDAHISVGAEVALHGVGLLPCSPEALHAIQLPAIVYGHADQLQRVGCHVERVLLRVLLGMGAQCGEGVATLVVEVAVLAEELGTLHGVGQVHAAEGLAELAHAVVVDRVPRQALCP